MSIKQRKENNRQCSVCSGSPSWNYYSVMCCDPCRIFFKNNSEKWAEKVKEGSSCGGNCPVTKLDRKCKYCRILKCFNAGMSQDKGRNAAAKDATNSSTKVKTPARRTKLSLKGSKKGVTLSDWTAKDKPTQAEFSVATDTTDVTNDDTTEEMEDDTKVPCVAALHNLGNTCFLNSVVQVLRYTPMFEEKVAVLAKEIKKTERERAQLAQLKQGMSDCGDCCEEDEEILTWVLVRNLHSVFRKMALAEEKFMSGQSNYIAIRPYDLLDTVERLNPMFQGNLQQDAHEFLRCLLAYVQDASRELNKYRKHTSQSKGCGGGDKMMSTGNDGALPLYTTPKEVEVLGGCNDENKVKDTTAAAGTTTTAKVANKMRTSQRLSGGKARMENGLTRSEDREESVTCNLVKAGITKRRSLTELQNQDYVAVSGGQMTILGSLVKGEAPGSGENGDHEAKGQETKGRYCYRVNGITADEERRLSGKRKAETAAVVADEPTKEALICEMYSEDCKGQRLNGGGGDALYTNGCHKRPRRSRESTVDSNNVFRMECEDGNENCDGEKDDPKENVSQEVIAKVQHRASLERKQTARKTMGGTKGDCAHSADSDDSSEPQISHNEQQKEEATRRQPIVKLDKNGITKYFAKVSKPKSLSDIERHTAPVVDLIEDLFQGQVALQTRCCECETVTERREAYQDISVAVRRRDDMEDDDEMAVTSAAAEDRQIGQEPSQDAKDDSIIGVDPFAWVRRSLGEVERLKDDNKYVCDRCCHLVEAERSMHYTSVPGVLTLHLKRFAMLHGLAGGFTKLTDHVPLPMVLPCIEDDCTDPHKHRLQLYGVVTHTGFTLSCGHYTAYVRADPFSPAILDLGMEQQLQASPTLQQSVTSGNDPPADPNNNQDNNNNVDTGSAPGLPGAGDASISVKSEAPSSSPSYWFECDDNIITVLTEEAFLSRVAPGHNNTNTPYLLFYQRVHVNN